MRPFLLAAALVFVAGPAFATAPNAQALYVERRGLLEVDAQCHLLEPDVRAAIQANAAQAAGALLRGGWTRARLTELEQATVSAARSRRCDDPRNASAARAAQAGFASWVHASAMNFTGAERTWSARRYADPSGWRLSQNTISPAATFGVRDDNGAQRLTLIMPLTSARNAPATAQLVVRDPARAGVELLDLRGRVTTGLAAGAPMPRTAARFLATSRTISQAQTGAQIMFEFPDAAFQALLALDPREAAEVHVGDQRILIEIGDIAAARAFLTIGQG